MKNQELMKWNVLLLLVVFIGFYNDSLGQNKNENPIEISFKHHADEIQGWFYKADGNGPVSLATLNTDHSFSNVQNELTETIHNWLKERE